MQGPRAPVASAFHFTAAVTKVGNEEVLIRIIANPKPEMMGQSREIQFKINWKRFLKLGNCFERFALPARASPKHRQDDVAIFSYAEIFNEPCEAGIGCVE